LGKFAMNDTISSPWVRRILPVVLTVLALVLLLYVVWRIDSAPRTDDAYAYADTINVTPQVNGNIVELAVHENQQVKAGDVLFRIDPRAYEDVLALERASLNALNQQIILTQRSVDAQRLSADASQAAVERARALARQAGNTLRRTQPLMPKGYVSAESLDQLGTAQRSARANP
jgi:multidrug efflux system membrane fusion protein